MKDNKKEKENRIDGTLKLLAERYPIGLYEYLFKYQPDLYRRIRDLEDEVDNAFLYRTTEDLKQILREYWVLHMEAIGEFENQDDLDLKINEVKEQIQQELLTV